MKRYASSLFLAFSLISVSGAQAQENYPSGKPVRLIVPASPGGGTDTITRLIAEQLGTTWGHSVVVQNKPGASGNIAGEYVAQSAPDGYTLLVGAAGTATVTPFLNDMRYDPMKDLAPAVALASSPMYLVVNPDMLPSRSVPELVNYVKESSAPLNWGSTPGAADMVAGLLLGKTANIDLTHIPYKGASEVAVDMLGGRVPLGVFAIAAVNSYLKTGQLVAIAGTEKERSSQLPDVPAVAESIPGYEAATWYGLWAPAGTPEDVIEKINTDVRKIVKDEAFRKRAFELGLEPMDYSPQEFATMLEKEAQRHGDILKDVPKAGK